MNRIYQETLKTTDALPQTIELYSYVSSNDKCNPENQQGTVGPSSVLRYLIEFPESTTDNNINAVHEKIMKLLHPIFFKDDLKIYFNIFKVGDHSREAMSPYFSGTKLYLFNSKTNEIIDNKYILKIRDYINQTVFILISRSYLATLDSINLLEIFKDDLIPSEKSISGPNIDTSNNSISFTGDLSLWGMHIEDYTLKIGENTKIPLGLDSKYLRGYKFNTNTNINRQIPEASGDNTTLINHNDYFGQVYKYNNKLVNEITRDENVKKCSLTIYFDPNYIKVKDSEKYSLLFDNSVKLSVGLNEFVIPGSPRIFKINRCR